MRNYIIDPSISYGCPEQDLAMLDLFSSALSHESKIEILDQLQYDSSQYIERVPFWQIYPLLVHVVLFGKNYIPSLNQAWLKIANV
jgi:fructosamine-3-kinase